MHLCNFYKKIPFGCVTGKNDINNNQISLFLSIDLIDYGFIGGLFRFGLCSQCQ